MGMKIAQLLGEIIRQILQKVHPSSSPEACTQEGGGDTLTHKACAQMLVAALSSVARDGRQPMCLSPGTWVSKTWHSHPVALFPDLETRAEWEEPAAEKHMCGRGLHSAENRQSCVDRGRSVGARD